MKNKDEFGIVTLRLKKNDWKLFKELAKINDTDASKEMRKFIRAYIAEHSYQIKNIAVERNCDEK